jgi:hypothetical protein
MFTFVFIVLVATLTATTYIIVSNMITDAYRYDTAIEKANEKVKLAAALGSDALYYGVRNVGTASVTLTEIGIISMFGSKTVLARDITLKPGEAYVSTAPSKTVGTFYVITARGNVFTTPVVGFGTSNQITFYLRNLVPGYIQAPSPISYGDSYKFTVGMATYAYIFGFLAVDDPYSDNYVYIQFGPYNVADLFKNQNIPLTDNVQQSSGPLSVTASFIFEIKDKGGESQYQHYKITMPLDAKRTDSRKGMILHGCIGIAWRTISNGLYSISVSNVGQTSCSPGGNYKVCDSVTTGIVPSAMDINALVAYLAKTDPTSLPLSAPSGSQAYIILTRCFHVEDPDLKDFKIDQEKAEEKIHGYRVHSYLVFPGKNKIGNPTVSITYVPVTMTVDPKIFVSAVLNQI